MQRSINLLFFTLGKNSNEPNSQNYSIKQQTEKGILKKKDNGHFVQALRCHVPTTMTTVLNCRKLTPQKRSIPDGLMFRLWVYNFSALHCSIQRRSPSEGIVLVLVSVESLGASLPRTMLRVKGSGAVCHSV